MVKLSNNCGEAAKSELPRGGKRRRFPPLSRPKTGARGPGAVGERPARVVVKVWGPGKGRRAGFHLRKRSRKRLSGPRRRVRAAGDCSQLQGPSPLQEADTGPSPDTRTARALILAPPGLWTASKHACVDKPRVELLQLHTLRPTLTLCQSPDTPAPGQPAPLPHPPRTQSGCSLGCLPALHRPWLLQAQVKLLCIHMDTAGLLHF